VRFSFGKLYHRNFRFGRPFSLLGLNALADGTVKRSGFVVFGMVVLFVLGVDERVLAVLADKDFVGHKNVLHRRFHIFHLPTEKFFVGEYL